MVLALAAYGSLLGANSLERLGRRLAVLRYDVTFAESTDERTILYLRSFQDDRTSLWFPFSDGTIRSVLFPRTTLEQTLSVLATMEGNVVAIGHPRERLPLPGAYRVYYRSTLAERELEWQDAVRRTAVAARGVIMMVGSSGAVAWEIGQLRQLHVLGKCLFVFPPGRDEDTWGRREALMDALGASGRERTLARLVPLEFLAAMGMRDDGTLMTYAAAGRDFRSYAMTLVSFWLALETNSSDSFWADGADGDDGSVRPVRVPSHRSKPSRPGADVRRVMRRGTGFWLAYQRDDYAKALAKCEQVIAEVSPAGGTAPTRPQGTSRPIEVQCYLASWHGRLLGANGRFADAIVELDRACGLAEAIPWVWIDAAECVPSDEHRYECCEQIIECLDQLGVERFGSVSRRDTAALMIALATHLDSRRKTAQGHWELAFARGRAGDFAAAADSFRSAEALYRRLGDIEAAERAKAMWREVTGDGIG